MRTEECWDCGIETVETARDSYGAYQWPACRKHGGSNWVHELKYDDLSDKAKYAAIREWRAHEASILLTKPGTEDMMKRHQSLLRGPGAFGPTVEDLAMELYQLYAGALALEKVEYNLRSDDKKFNSFGEWIS